MLLVVLKILQEVENLKEAIYTSYEELPLFLNAETLAKLLGVSVSSSYELMHEKDFPAIRIGSRLVVPKEKLQRWKARIIFEQEIFKTRSDQRLLSVA